MASSIPRAAAALSVALLAGLPGCAAPPRDGAAAAAEAPGPEWVRIAQRPEGVLYIDPRATVRVGPSVFLTMLDVRTGMTVVVRERIEIDCEGKRVRRYDSTLHGDRAALGPALAQAGQDDWRALNPDPRTVLTALAKLACPGGMPDPPGAAPPPAPRTGRLLKT